jgi:hypothetical protein
MVHLHHTRMSVVRSLGSRAVVLCCPRGDEACACGTDCRDADWGREDGERHLMNDISSS